MYLSHRACPALIRKENRTAVEEGALAGSGISTVISRAGDTFSMADDPLADKLAKGAKRTGLAGTGLSTFASIVSAGSGDSSWTHAGVNGEAAFNWPTTRKLFQNTRRARWQAAQKLARQITEAAENDPDMLIQIVAHSHGGNVAIMAANILENRDITVDRLVMLGTPHRSYYELNNSDTVGELVNAYSRNDGIQELGAYSLVDIAMGNFDLTGPRSRPDREGAVNVDVTVQSDDKVSHTTLHTREEVINFIHSQIN